MLKQIKKYHRFTLDDLSNFLEGNGHNAPTHKTLRNWDKNDNWPSWALRKLGLIVFEGE